MAAEGPRSPVEAASARPYIRTPAWVPDPRREVRNPTKGVPMGTTDATLRLVLLGVDKSASKTFGKVSAAGAAAMAGRDLS